MMSQSVVSLSGWAMLSSRPATGPPSSANGMSTDADARATSRRSAASASIISRRWNARTDYNQSAYYDNDDPSMRFWDGYDVFAQTAEAQAYVESQSGETPFMLVLSWGPPHNPYQTAPQEYRDLYDPSSIELRPNVPPEMAEDARKWLAGYYAHCSAIDKSVGDIMRTLDKRGISDDTVLVFASDHGDMLGSQGWTRKQKPWDESIRVPFLLRYPGKYGREARETKAFLNAHDIMPTLLGVCDLPIPDSVEGRDFSGALDGETIESACRVDTGSYGALLACFHPFGEWSRPIAEKSIAASERLVTPIVRRWQVLGCFMTTRPTPTNWRISSTARNTPRYRLSWRRACSENWTRSATNFLMAWRISRCGAIRWTTAAQSLSGCRGETCLARSPTGPPTRRRSAGMACCGDRSAAIARHLPAARQ